MISTRQLVIFEGTDDKPAIHQPLGQLLGSSVRCIANLGLHVGIRYLLEERVPMFTISFEYTIQ